MLRCSRSICLTLFLLLGAGAAGLAAPAPANPAGLAVLEEWALQSADALSLADVQAQLTQARLQAAEAEAGPHWTLGGSTGSYIDPTSDTTTRSYSGVNAVAGIRWPILGSAPGANRDVREARIQLALEPLRRAYARSQVLAEVRQAYWTLVYNQRLAALAQRWLQSEPQVVEWTQARTRAHLLLDADRRALQSGFYVARRDAARYRNAAAAALATLQRLSGHTFADVDVPSEGPTPACAGAPPPDAQWDTVPLLALRRAEVQAREVQAGDSKWNSVQAGVTLQQSLGSTYGGVGAQSTVLGIDMTIPLDLRAAHRARATEAELRLQQARLEWQVARQQLQSEWSLAAARLEAAAADLARARQRAATSAEGVREAEARVLALEGDVMEKSLVARYDLYQSLIDFTDTQRRAALANLDVPDFGTSVSTCEPPVLAASDGDAALRTWSDLLDLPLPAHGPAALQPAPSAWFLWDGDAFLDGSALRWPAPSGHLWVSFSAQKLAEIQGSPLVGERLRQVLEQAHQQGWQVEWVLSDAAFLLPDGNQRLRQWVHTMNSFAFDGLNLDCERSDLPAARQPDWERLLLNTVAAIRADIAWPITVTAHYREFQDRSLVADWRSAGIQRVAAMVYLSDAGRVQQIARTVLQRQTGLPVWLVASTEAELPPSESWYAQGQATTRAAWQALAQGLSGFANFRGLAVQSLDQFSRMKP